MREPLAGFRLRLKSSLVQRETLVSSKMLPMVASREMSLHKKTRSSGGHKSWFPLRAREVHPLWGDTISIERGTQSSMKTLLIMVEVDLAKILRNDIINRRG